MGYADLERLVSGWLLYLTALQIYHYTTSLRRPEKVLLLVAVVLGGRVGKGTREREGGAGCLIKMRGPDTLFP